MRGKALGPLIGAALLAGCDRPLPPPAYTAEQTIAATKQCQDAGLEVVFFTNAMTPGVARGHQCRPTKDAEK